MNTFRKVTFAPDDSNKTQQVSSGILRYRHYHCSAVNSTVELNLRVATDTLCEFLSLRIYPEMFLSAEDFYQVPLRIFVI